eukprot:6826614-Heterocapsa_arctica.AAC.1
MTYYIPLPIFKGNDWRTKRLNNIRNGRHNLFCMKYQTPPLYPRLKVGYGVFVERDCNNKLRRSRVEPVANLETEIGRGYVIMHAG